MRNQSVSMTSVSAQRQPDLGKRESRPDVGLVSKVQVKPQSPTAEHEPLHPPLDLPAKPSPDQEPTQRAMRTQLVKEVQDMQERQQKAMAAENNPAARVELQRRHEQEQAELTRKINLLDQEPAKRPDPTPQPAPDEKRANSPSQSPTASSEQPNDHSVNAIEPIADRVISNANNVIFEKRISDFPPLASLWQLAQEQTKNINLSSYKEARLSYNRVLRKFLKLLTTDQTEAGNKARDLIRESGLAFPRRKDEPLRPVMPVLDDPALIGKLYDIDGLKRLIRFLEIRDDKRVTSYKQILENWEKKPRHTLDAVRLSGQHLTQIQSLIETKICELAIDPSNIVFQFARDNIHMDNRRYADERTADVTKR
ncbi:MAG: hypothetical protein L0Z50_23675 [Verrucomicrobiales bacterium]|nr:hypothetical protein [Verrucomicrobiales bacterium]